MKNPFAVAALGGATISLIPAWFVSWLSSTYPSLRPEDLQVVSDFFSEEFGILHIIVFSIIIFAMPVFEEYLFRGVLWKLVHFFSNDRTAMILTSIAFACAHLEPLHILGLLPLSLFLGWLRMKTGNVEASILAHMSNNLVACLLMVV